MRVGLCLSLTLQVLSQVKPSHPCPEGKYLSKSGSCCSYCKSGQYSVSLCSSVNETVCAPCSPGTYTDSKNVRLQCMRCKTCRRGLGLVRLSVCTAERDAVCGCPEGQVCVKDPINQAQCKGCEDLMPCPSGTYTETAGNSSSHPVCSPCPIGTFNTEASLTAVCVNHTDCSRLGKIQADPGTPESDAVCKDSDTTVWFVWVCLAALCLCVPVMMISCIRKRLRPHIRDCHQAEKGGHKTSQLPLLSSSSSSSSSIQQCLSPPPALPPAPLEQDQHVGHAISRAPHCSHPIITGGMTVNGNVFIYNGSTINNAPLASAPSPAPAPSPSLPHSVEESPVPTQEQQGPPGSVQERGKDFHISVEESRERDCGL